MAHPSPDKTSQPGTGTKQTSPATASGTASPRALAWNRRVAAAKKNWSIFLEDRAGVAGGIILILVVLVAAFAPLIADRSMLDVTQTLDQPRYAPPSAEHPLGTCLLYTSPSPRD